MNLYVDLDAFKEAYLNDSDPDTPDQARILAWVEAASRRIDDVANRHFFEKLVTNYYTGSGKAALWFPSGPDGDILTITTLKVDEDGDGTYEVELTELTGYWLFPDNATPKIGVEINPESTKLSKFPNGRRRVEIVGTEGYTNATERESVTATVADASTTTMTSSGAGALAIGQTLLLETEQVYISAGASPAWTITRGVNGTTAAAHTGGTVIDRYVYDERVRAATLTQAGDWWLRRNTAFARVESPSFGTAVTIPRGVHPDVWGLLERLRVPVVA